MKLLSVDFDFFFPTLEREQPFLWDWGHLEVPFMIHRIWQTRAEAFIRNNVPLPQLNDEWKNFWDRTKLTKNAILYVGESHCHMVAAKISRGVNEVVNFDAHHDLGYGRLRTFEALRSRMIDCQVWGAVYVERGKKLTVVYPRWKSDFEERDGRPEFKANRVVDDGRIVGPFGRVYVCRSGAWVPSWLDQHWEAFIEACPATKKIWIEPTPNRNFNLEEAHTDAERMKQMLSRYNDNMEVRMEDNQTRET